MYGKTPEGCTRSAQELELYLSLFFKLQEGLDMDVAQITQFITNVGFSYRCLYFSV